MTISEEQTHWLEQLERERTEELKHAHELIDAIEKDGSAATVRFERRHIAFPTFGDQVDVTIEIPEGPKR